MGKPKKREVTKVSYFVSDNIVKSLKEFENNWKLVLPGLLYGVFAIFMVLCFALLNIDLLSLASKVVGDSGVGPGAFLEYFSNVAVLWKFILSTFALFVISFFIGIIVQYTKYGMMVQVLNGKRARLISSYFQNKKYFYKIILVRVIVFAIILIALLVALLFVALLRVLFANSVAYTVLMILGGLLLVVVAIYVKLNLMFVYPALFLDNVGVIKTFLKSSRFFLKNKKYVLLVFLIIIFSVLIAQAVQQVFSIFSYIPGITNIIWLFVAVTVIISIIQQLVGLVVSTWNELFLFNSYNNYKK